MPRLLFLTLCAGFLCLPSAAQMKGRAPAAGLYGPVPAAWTGPLRSFADQAAGRLPGLTSKLPLLIAGLEDPAGRVRLAPLIMSLEAQGLTPGTFSVMDEEAQAALVVSAAASAERLVAEEARSLIERAGAATPGRQDLPAVAAKLYLLQRTLGTYLTAEHLGLVHAAYEQSRAKLSQAQRARIDAALKDNARALGRLLAADSPSAEDGIRAEAADGNSLTRRQARLQPSRKTRGSKEAAARWRALLAAARENTARDVRLLLERRSSGRKIKAILASKDTKTITEFEGVPGRIEELADYGRIYRHWVRQEADLRSILSTRLVRGGPVSYVEFTGSSRAFIKDIYPDLHGVFFTVPNNLSSDPRVMNEDAPHYVDFRIPEGVRALSLDGTTVMMIPAETGAYIPVEIVGSSFGPAI